MTNPYIKKIKTMKRNEFVTYGFHVDEKKFNGLQKENRRTVYLNKPDGGLWGSPVDSKLGWIDWCKGEDFRLERLSTYTKWKLRDLGRILVIDGYLDLVKAMDKYGYCPDMPGRWYLDFWKIGESGFSGMMLTENGNRECHLPMKKYNGGFIDLNAWDCESIVVWDWDQIEVLGIY